MNTQTFLSPPLPLRPNPPSRPSLPRHSPHCSAKLPRTLSTSPTAPTLIRSKSHARRWHPPHLSNLALARVHKALLEWSARTGKPTGLLPSDSYLRRCETAKSLGLHRLIVLAGGHSAVARDLSLQPMRTATAIWKDAELVQLARWLETTCAQQGLPSPRQHFPDKRVIQRIDPPLGNRIAQFPGRNGYHVLERYVTNPALDTRLKSSKKNVKTAQVPHVDTRQWGVWTDPAKTRAFLSAYQLHPQVLPRLCSLPPVLAAAIQRQGGAAVFVDKYRMVLDKDWANITRFAKLVAWLASVSSPQTLRKPCSSEEYMEFVRAEYACPPPFPSRAEVSEAGMSEEIRRYGGRKGLALRMGYERTKSAKDLFMGNFSVTFAADLLDYAGKQVYVSDDCSVAMPSMQSMRANGRDDLAAAVLFFGGEVEVGRRLGLVPLTDIC